MQLPGNTGTGKQYLHNYCKQMKMQDVGFGNTKKFLANLPIKKK
jgi:hypothetical protein